MFFFDVMYYHYYIFYRFVYREPDPEITAKLSLSACEIFLVNAIASIIAAYFFGYKFSRTEGIIIAIVVLALNFFVILKPKREKRIIESEPKLFKSHKASVVIAWIFLLLSMSILFWLNDAVNYFLELGR